MRDVPGLIAAVAAQHGEWYWRPTKERQARSRTDARQELDISNNPTVGAL